MEQGKYKFTFRIQNGGQPFTKEKEYTNKSTNSAEGIIDQIREDGGVFFKNENVNSFDDGGMFIPWHAILGITITK